jgi:plastocyanin
MVRFVTTGSRAAAMALWAAAAACSAPAEAPHPDSTPTSAAAASAEEQMVTGRAPIGDRGLSTVVMLLPETPVEVTATKPSLMDQINLTFVPGLLLVRAGEPVHFRNSEDVMHNVRVRNENTKEGTFNVALPTGGTYEHVFESDGFYDVGCDIHPGMSALIIAVSTPYATVADQTGAFTIPGVRPGTYTAVTYLAGVRNERVVEIGTGRTELNLTGS